MVSARLICPGHIRPDEGAAGHALNQALAEADARVAAAIAHEPAPPRQPGQGWWQRLMADALFVIIGAATLLQEDPLDLPREDKP
ncbi:hypothetical protein EOD42_06200 [Rhodovarius crocodyli]|uniref:Uncharacterized protein n=1 Tax=Rhodovarius crocodyli TaxID=1979269 RepID=A0A437MIF8_9PROT|nr:hypothetical protein [Rhodovarius crocodyli]RVT97422.1 hypothetical protein EOD42_06200 [Rhodovarius crocodyli]